MKQFQYVITDPVGIHARPAGLLVKAAKEYTSKITLQKDDRSSDATRLMNVMGLGIKCGDTVIVTVEGSDEDAAAKGIQEFLTANL